MNRQKMGILLAIYGILGGLFETFVSYAYVFYLNETEGSFLLFIYQFLNPLTFFYQPSVLTILVIGVYPFAMIALGLYLIVSKKKRK